LRLASLSDVQGEAGVTLGVRPEFMRLRTDGQGALAARVERLEFLGSEVIVFAKLAAIGETMLAKVAPGEARGLVAGQPIGLDMDPAHVMLFAEDGRRLPAAPVSAVLRETARG
jgi:multiple sugar transport system ATP-binding protein